MHTRVTTTNVTELVNPPLPQIRTPVDPCQGITATDADVEGIGKCSVSSHPGCQKLQNRFLAIQVGIQDQRDELLEEIDITNKQCKQSHDTLSNEFQELEQLHETEQTKLAGATADENTALEEAKLKSTEYKHFESELSPSLDKFG